MNIPCEVFREFQDACLEYDVFARVECQEVWEAWLGFCRKNHYLPCSRQALGHRILRFSDPHRVGKGQSGLDRKYHYFGIILKKEGGYP